MASRAPIPYPICPRFPSCLARVTGELTMTFPAGIVRVFSGTPPPPVLSFRLVHTAPVEHFQPNADLIFRCLAWAVGEGPRCQWSQGPIGPPASCCVAWGKWLFLSGPTAPTAASLEWEGVS